MLPDAAARVERLVMDYHGFFRSFWGYLLTVQLSKG